MTTLENRTDSALLLVDVQVGVVAEAHERDAVVATIDRLVERARIQGVPVVWVRHADEGLAHGSDAWQIVPELVPADGEPVVDKRYGDAFEDTALEAELARRSIGRLVIAGACTDQCVRSTLHGGFTRGYDVTLVTDAHTTTDLTAWGAPPPERVIAHTNLYWSHQAAPGRTAEAVTADAVSLRTP